MTTVALPGHTTMEQVGVSRAVADAVQEVYEATGGEQLAQAVVDHARDVNSPLHPHFEWDDHVAAEAHRLWKSAQLIRRVRIKVVPVDDPRPVLVRRYVANVELPATPERSPEGGSYTAIEHVAGDTAAQVALMQSIERDVARLQAKYASVGDFARIVRDLLPEE